MSCEDLSTTLHAMQGRQAAVHRKDWLLGGCQASGMPLTMLPIQPGAGCCTQEELAAVCVLASIGHTEDACACVLELEIFILKVSAIDGLSTSAIACSSSD